jgi:4-hydroxy-tetrahydrodipicolinate synthase
MVTPFDATGRVDEEATVHLMRHLLDNGSDGLVVAGTTGEGATLTDDEKLRLWELAVSEVGDEAYLVAGTGSNDTAHSVHLTERATEIGVDAHLVVCPYYNKPNRRGLIAHYRAVAGATDRPVILYNIPARCVVDMDNDLLRELGEIEHIEAVKQARYEDLTPIDGLDLLAGNDDTLARVMDLGGTGGILVSSHVIGREMRRMIDEPDTRHELHDRYADLFEAMFVTSSPTPVKAALNMLGIEVGGLRLPMVEASEDEAAQVRAALERHGLLSAV